jgi:hypothetical protein
MHLQHKEATATQAVQELAAERLYIDAKQTMLTAGASTVIGGGGANLHQLTAPILRTFPHATIAPDPQSAIPRGYARYTRRLEQQEDV